MGGVILSIRVFFTLIAAAALVAGCGGGDDSEATANRGKITVETGSLSKAEFVEQVDGICKETKERFFKEVRAKSERVAENRRIGPETQYGIYASVIDPLYHEMAEQIGALGAPTGDEKRITELVNAIPRDIDDVDANPIKAFDDGTPLSETLKLAEAYGLNGCVESLT
jgi:hypothetical protein